jgi:hypothetical protein
MYIPIWILIPVLVLLLIFSRGFQEIAASIIAVAFSLIRASFFLAVALAVLGGAIWGLCQIPKNIWDILNQSLRYVILITLLIFVGFILWLVLKEVYEILMEQWKRISSEYRTNGLKNAAVYISKIICGILGAWIYAGAVIYMVIYLPIQIGKPYGWIVATLAIAFWVWQGKENSLIQKKWRKFQKWTYTPEIQKDS